MSEVELAKTPLGTLTWHECVKGSSDVTARMEDFPVFGFFFVGSNWKVIKEYRGKRVEIHPRECWSLCKIHRGYLLVPLTEMEEDPGYPADREFWGANSDGYGYCEGLRERDISLVPRTLRGKALEEVCRFAGAEAQPDPTKVRQLERLLETARFLRDEIAPGYRQFLLSPEGACYPGLRRLLQQDLRSRFENGILQGIESLAKEEEASHLAYIRRMDPLALFKPRGAEDLRHSLAWFSVEGKHSFRSSEEGGVWDEAEDTPQPYATVLEVEKVHVLRRLQRRRGPEKEEEETATKRRHT